MQFKDAEYTENHFFQYFVSNSHYLLFYEIL